MLTNVLQYLENTVSVSPDKLAFSDGEASLSFRELYDSARRVGTFLLKKGIKREGVAVFMKRHPSQLAAFFGAAFGGLVASLTMIASGSSLSGLFLLGCSLASAGIGILWIFVCKYSTKGLVWLTSAFVKSLFLKKGGR